jgi:hypothetical protein
VRQYAWAEELEAFCFTAVVGLDVDEVVRRLGGDPDSTARLSFEECFWEPGSDQWLQVGAIDGAVLVAENNGWRASEDDTAVQVSLDARLATFFCNINAVMRFVWAVDGAIVSAFDPLLDPKPVEGKDPRALDPFMADLPFGLADAGSCSLTLLERLTGVRVTPQWLGQAQLAFALPPLT